jgi:hypothetical protein
MLHRWLPCVGPQRWMGISHSLPQLYSDETEKERWIRPQNMPLGVPFPCELMGGK